MKEASKPQDRGHLAREAPRRETKGQLRGLRKQRIRSLESAVHRVAERGRQRLRRQIPHVTALVLDPVHRQVDAIEASVIGLQFGTLATIKPGRIDLGLGRAPGGDMAVAWALRRSMDPGDGFPHDVVELMEYLRPARPDAPVRAVPGEGTEVPIWILGSSLYGAQLAAHLGLPYAFASHFAPAALDEAVELYRRGFRPSRHLERPRFMLAVNVFAADTDEEGAHLRTTMQLAFARLRQGRPGKLPRPVRDIDAEVGPEMRAAVDAALRVSAVGSPATVRGQLQALVRRYVPDELILTGQIHDHAARVKSFGMAAELLRDIAAAA